MDPNDPVFRQLARDIRRAPRNSKLRDRIQQDALNYVDEVDSQDDRVFRATQRTQDTAQRQQQKAIEAQQRAAIDQQNDATEAAFRPQGRSLYTDSRGVLLPTQSDDQWQAEQQEKQAKEAERAQKEAATLQERQRREQLRISKAQGVRTEVDPSTAEERIVQRPDGKPVYKPEVLGAPTVRQEGDRRRAVARFRDADGMEYTPDVSGVEWDEANKLHKFKAQDGRDIAIPGDRRLTQIDPKTGDVSVLTEDPVTRQMVPVTIGKDQRTVTELEFGKRGGLIDQEERRIADQLALRKAQGLPLEEGYKALKERADKFKTEHFRRVDGTLYSVNAKGLTELKDAVDKDFAEQWLADRDKTNAEFEPLKAKYEVYQAEVGKLKDSQLSASEKKRRLADYKAKYLSEFDEAKKAGKLPGDPDFDNALDGGKARAEAEAARQAQIKAREDGYAKMSANPALAPYAEQFRALDGEFEAALGELAKKPGSKETPLMLLQEKFGQRRAAVRNEMQSKLSAADTIYREMSKLGTSEPEERHGRVLVTSIGRDLGLSEDESVDLYKIAREADFTKGNPGDKVRVSSLGNVMVNPKLWANPEEAKAAIEASPATPDQKAAAISQLPEMQAQAKLQEEADFSKGNKSAPVRVLSNGAIALNPADAFNPNKLSAAITESGASEEAKAKAMEQIPAMEEEAAGRMAYALGQIPAFERFEKANEGAFKTKAELIRAYQQERGAMAHIDQAWTGALSGMLSTAQSVAAIGGFLRIPGAMDTAVMIGQDTAKLGQASKAIGAGQLTNMLAAQTGSLITSFAGGGAGAAVGKHLLKKKLGEAIVAKAAFAGTVAASGAAQFGNTFADAYSSYVEQGLSEDEALNKATLPALASGATTAIVTALGGRLGVEAGVVNAATRGVIKEATKGYFRGIAGSIAKGAGAEFAEEAADQVLQGIIAKASYNPDKTWEEILNEGGEAGLIGAILGGTVQGGSDAVSFSMGEAQSRGQKAAQEALLAASNQELEAFTANPPLDIDPSLAQSARVLRDIAQGADLQSFPEADLRSVGITRAGKGELKNIGGKEVPAVKLENGKPIITQAALDTLEQTFPETRAMIGMDEQTARAKFREQTTLENISQVEAESQSLDSSEQLPSGPAGPASISADLPRETTPPGSTPEPVSGPPPKPRSAWHGTAQIQINNNVPRPQRKGAIEAADRLDPILQRYAPLFPRGTSHIKEERGGGIQYGGGKLEIDLGRMGEMLQNMPEDQRDAWVEAAVQEEVVHRAATEAIPRPEMERLWSTLSPKLQKHVTKAYYQGNAPAEVDGWAMGHEFIRMLVQDSAFAGKVSESIGVNQTLGRALRELLNRIAAFLRRNVDKLPPETKAGVEQAEQRVIAKLKELGLETASAKAPEAKPKEQGGESQKQDAPVREAANAKEETPSDPVQAAYQEEVTSEADALAQEMAGLFEGETVTEESSDTEALQAGSRIAEPSDIRKTISDAMRSPEKRKRVYDFILRKFSEQARAWDKLIAEKGDVLGGMEGLIQAQREESMRAEADFDETQKELRQGLAFDMGGLVQDKAPQKERDALKAKYTKQLADNARKWAREKTAMDARHLAARKAMSGKAAKDNEKERLLAAMKTFDAILSVMPPEVRGRIVGLTKIASLTTDSARVKEIQRRVEKMHEVFESWMKKDYSEQFGKLLEKAMPRGGPGEKAKGKLGPEGHHVFSLISDAAVMTQDEVDRQIAGLEADLARPENADIEKRADLMERQQILEMFGDFQNRNSDGMSKALDWAKAVYAVGRNAWKAKEIARMEADKGRQADAREDTGNSGSDAELQRTREAIHEGKKAGTLTSLLSFVQNLELAFGRGSKLVERWNQQAREATAKKTDAMLSKSKQWEDFQKTLWPGKKTLDRKRAMYRLKTVQDVVAPKMEGAKEETVTFDESTALGIANGTLDPKRYGLKPEHVAELRSQVNNPRKKVFKITKVAFDGKPESLTMTQMQAVHISMLWKQERYKAALDRWGWTPDAIETIERQISPEAKQIRAWLANEYETGFDPLNDLYEKMYGVRLGKEANYAPGTFHHDNANPTVDASGNALLGEGGMRSGFLKQRQNHQSKPDIQQDAMDLFFRHHAQTQHWLAFAELSREFRAVIGNRDVQSSVAAASGPEMGNNLKFWAEALERGGFDQSITRAVDKWVNGLVKNQAAMALAFKVSTLMKQSSAAFGTLMRIPTKDWAKGFGKAITGRLSLKEAYNSDVIQRRLQSGYSPEVRMAMDQLAKAEPTRTAEFIEKGMDLIGWVDAAFTTVSAAISYDYHLNQMKAAGVGDVQAKRIAAAKMADDVARTAQPAEMIDRSLGELRAQGFGKLMFMFASSPRQLAANLGMAEALRRKGQGNLGEVVRNLMVANLIGGVVMQGISSAWRDIRDDDDDEIFDLENWKPRDFIKVGVAGALSGVPLINGAFDAFLDFAMGTNPLGGIGKGATSLSKLITWDLPSSAKKEPYEWAMRQAVTTLQGVALLLSVLPGNKWATRATNATGAAIAGNTAKDVVNIVDNATEEN